MTEEQNPLGDFLRARRELVTPEQAGIPVLGVRRVKGLRREEVAMLAGISGEYYLRLEQGRYRNPSVQVLESIARVLRLDDETQTYLFGLAADRPRARKRQPKRETVPPGILMLLDALPLPAFVEGRYLDVLAANPLATALSPRLVKGANRLRDVLLDPDEQALFVDWEIATEVLVASFRQSVGTDIDNPRCIELVGQLSLASPRFRRLWDRHDIGGRHGALMRLTHPTVGPLTLHREKLALTDAPTLTLAVYHATPGTPDADALALLAASSVRDPDRFIVANEPSA
jgi:transcriptional regulator with XRE-family HTH domain